MVRSPPLIFCRINRPDVLLGGVVGERHGEVGGEAQHVVAVGVEAVEQVDRRTAFAGAAGRAVGVGPPPGLDELAVAGAVAGEQVRVQAGGAVLAGPVHGCVDLDEQAGHGVRPVGLAGGLGDGVEFAQVVGVAEGVGEVRVGAVGRPAVVHGHPGEGGQHPGVVHGGDAALVVAGEQGPGRGRRGVHPGQVGVHPQARLVEADHARGGQLVADGGGEQVQPGGGAVVPGHHRPGRDGGAEQVGQCFRGPGDRQMLGGAQVGRHPANPGSVLGGGTDPVRRRRHRDLPAPTAPMLDPVFGDGQPHLGQVENLPAFHRAHPGPT